MARTAKQAPTAERQEIAQQPAGDEKLSYEDALTALDGVVRRMESGEGSLEELLMLYERGMALVKQCNAQLDAYETKIIKLADLEEGEHADRS